MSAPGTLVDECGSTNDLARQLAQEGAPHGAWVSARRQGAGRGRGGRKWESIEGNLFLSLVVRIPPGPHWSWIPLAAAVGAAEYLRGLDPRLDIRLKWPNDLWLDGRKLGGLLCEAFAAGTSGGGYAIVGLGLNCARAPEALGGAATSLAEWSASLEVDALRAPIAAAMSAALEDLGRLGGGAIAARYSALAWLKPGDPIEWSAGAVAQTGRVEGIGESGELLVQASLGGIARLFAEDVRLKTGIKRA